MGRRLRLPSHVATPSALPPSNRIGRLFSYLIFARSRSSRRTPPPRRNSMKFSSRLKACVAIVAFVGVGLVMVGCGAREAARRTAEAATESDEKVAFSEAKEQFSTRYVRESGGPAKLHAGGIRVDDRSAGRVNFRLKDDAGRTLTNSDTPPAGEARSEGESYESVADNPFHKIGQRVAFDVFDRCRHGQLFEHPAVPHPEHAATARRGANRGNAELFRLRR